MSEHESLHEALEEMELPQDKIDEVMSIVEKTKKDAVTTERYAEAIRKDTAILREYGMPPGGTWQERAAEVARRISNELDK